MTRVGKKSVVLVVLATTIFLVSSAPAPSPVSCPPCSCDTPPAKIYELNTTDVNGVPAFHCNNPGARGYRLAQTCNGGTYGGAALYCNPTNAVESSLGFIAATTEVGVGCTSNSDCQQGTFCSSVAPNSQLPVCTYIAVADCFTACDACICNPSPAPAPAPYAARKLQ